jgi:DNA modification methylase
LDPFSGAGTVAMVADRLGRNAIGCELSTEYEALATDRLVGDSPMFTEIVA